MEASEMNDSVEVYDSFAIKNGVKDQLQKMISQFLRTAWHTIAHHGFEPHQIVNIDESKHHSDKDTGYTYDFQGTDQMY